MKLSKLCAVFLLTPALALCAEWHCQNQDMEVSCSQTVCEAAEAFTPIDVTVSDLGSMIVCAYSGCWSGKGKVLKSGAHVIISANKLKWSGTSPNPATFIVGLDKTDNIAVIKGSNFAMPLICKSGGA
jgi:hypothetical protein